ncbi:hypothetical protein OC844_001712 [Tilletia horrida]|nr:hypothetical protein OC844_001712 [Tilletia horrida]
MQDIRSFFGGKSASSSSSPTKRRRVEAADDASKKHMPTTPSTSTPTPAALHPFFNIKHGRRPTQSTEHASREGAVKVDSPLPTPESMFCSTPGQTITKLSKSLDLVYWPAFIASPADAASLYSYLLNNLAWHRVKYYKDKFKQSFSTPRWTTTFGRDDGEDPDSTYERRPRAVPTELKQIQAQIEARTGERFNAIIVNYYADGNDSISYHSDDEGFLGPNPAIASFTLGTPRPFLLRRKAHAPPAQPSADELKLKDRPSVLQPVLPTSSRAITRPTYRLPLPPGSLLLMRGRTQHEWEHSIPKSTAKGGAAVAGYGGRMNLTFRLVKKRGGTENFIQYNIGQGPQYRWDGSKMVEAGGGL